MNNQTLKTSSIRAFLNGFISAFDITGGIKIPDLTNGWEQDREALRGDWQRVGDDMRRAMNMIAHEQ